ncbi:MAG: hypothetical protein RL150_681 [Candidatus Parcubacteria bacterium]|jgi:hypothetical protein
MKKLCTILTIVFAIVVGIGFFWSSHKRHQDAVEDQVSSLVPWHQQEVRDYAEMTSTLKVGDLVLVIDNKVDKNERHLAVTKVDEFPGNRRIHLEGRYDTPETMFLWSGLEEGLKVNNTYSFHPIYQDSPGYTQLATWFWIQ